MISTDKLKKIKKKISSEFPEFKGIEPKITEKIVTPQKGIYRKLTLGVPKIVKKVYSLKFTKKIKTVDAVKMERILIVTLNEQGEIIKVSQSR